MTETIYLAPNKVAIPDAPAIEVYDSRYGLDHPNNFRKFQRNAVILTDYIINLRSIIRYYESEIDRIEQLRREEP